MDIVVVVVVVGLELIISRQGWLNQLEGDAEDTIDLDSYEVNDEGLPSACRRR